MKILLDEMMPRPLRRHLVGHSAVTIAEAGWRGVKNGELLRLAEQEFDLFLTMDANLPFQQKLDQFQLRFVIVHAVRNSLRVLRPLVPQILQAMNHVQPRQVIHVPPQHS